MSNIRIFRSIAAGSLGLGLLIGTSACYTTTNKITFSSLDTSYPVSASPQYIDNTGAIVTPTEYQVLERFEFVRVAKGPRHEETTTKLNLKPQLDSIMTRTRGDAITRTRIDVLDYNRGSHLTSGVLKLMGWNFSLGGVAFFALIPSAPDRQAATLGAVGGATLGLGVLFFVLGAFVADDPSAWKFRVTGDVVRRQPPALPVPPPPPAVEPATVTNSTPAP